MEKVKALITFWCPVKGAQVGIPAEEMQIIDEYMSDRFTFRVNCECGNPHDIDRGA